MSDIEAPTGGEADELGPDEGIADTEAVEQVEADEAAPQYDFLEVDDSIRGKHVMTKVDGEEVAVPFEELINSYSREAVSTQRFQKASELAQQADRAIRLQQALEHNPGLTVQYLAQEAGVSVEQYLGMSPQERQAATDDNSEDEYLDPLERELREQRAQIQQMRDQFEQQQADEQLLSAVNQLKGTYQLDDSQARAVVGRTMQMGLGINALPMVYQSMAYEASQQATAQHTAEQEAEKARRQAAAHRASQATSSGTGATNTTTEVGTQNFTSIRDAANAALEGLGIQ